MMRLSMSVCMVIRDRPYSRTNQPTKPVETKCWAGPVLGWCGQPFALSLRWCTWATQASPPHASSTPAPTEQRRFFSFTRRLLGRERMLLHLPKSFLYGSGLGATVSGWDGSLRKSQKASKGKNRRRENEFKDEHLSLPLSREIE